MTYNFKKTVAETVKEYFYPVKWLYVNRGSLRLRATYALRLVACLALFWEPFVYGTVTRQDWKDAVSHCWHVVRTGDVWSA